MSATATSERVEYDLSNVKSRKDLLAILDAGDDDAIQPIIDNSSLDDFIRDGSKPCVTLGDVMIFDLTNEDKLAMVQNGIIYEFDDVFTTSLRRICLSDAKAITGYKNPLKNQTIIGFVADREITIGKQTYAKTVIRRGDSDNNTLVEELSNDFPTISLDCMGQMFEDDNDDEALKAVAKKIGSEQIVIVDFIPDQTKPLTAAQKKMVQKSQQKRDPSLMPVGDAGFSVVNDEWHRSSTIVLLDKGKDGTGYLFGQDEGTYFGCKLADKCETVADAFTSLMPPEVRGKTFQRQGEWFLLSVNEKDVPKLEDSVAILTDGCGLPITDPESNVHHITSSSDNGVRIAKDGSIYADSGSLEHDEHATLHWSDWVRFYRNTALKSVSAEANVD